MVQPRRTAVPFHPLARDRRHISIVLCVGVGQAPNGVGRARDAPTQDRSGCSARISRCVRIQCESLPWSYVKRGKTDAADAEAICEAVTRPNMHFVPIKTAEQQAALM